MNILITGISGFVGSNFTESWKNRHTIYGLDITGKPIDGVIKIYSWNQLEQIPPIDAIVHLAGKAHDTKNESLAKEYFDINTALTKKIFDFFMQSTAKTFIFASSVKAAADSVSGDILTEDIVPDPKGPYGESKILAEKYILEKTSNLQVADKKIHILRPAMIHGSGNKGNLNLLYKVVKKGIPWPLGAFENRRSFCSIDNITFVVEHLITDNIESGIYHICDDEPLSTNQLIELIAESLNRKTAIWQIPKSWMQGVAKLGTVMRMPLNNERLRKLTENYVVSNKKIKKALRISQMPVTAVEGMKKTLESFK